MRPAYLQVVIIVICLILVPAMWAQESATANQTASPASLSLSEATVPQLIEFTGSLLDRSNRPMVGPIGMTFALYAEQTGGAALWMETQNVRPDATGNYTVFLGAASNGGLPVENFAAGKARWLGIQVEHQAEQPRVMLVSVPYALKARDAETLGGLPASAFLSRLPQGATGSNAAWPGGTPDTAQASANSIQPPTSNGQPLANSVNATIHPAVPCTTFTGGGVTNFIAAWSSHCGLSPSALAETCTTSGCNVGVGTQAPQAGMDVEAPASSTTGVMGVTSNSAFFAAGVFGHATATSGLTRGVYGASESPSGIGVHGIGQTGGQFESGTGLILRGRGFGSDQFTIDAGGNMRLSGGFSAGGTGLVQIDAPGIAGGRFTILPNGNVGINKASPTATLDVGGAANVSGSVNVGSSLKINGDTPMSAAPRMHFSAFFPGNFSTFGKFGGYLILDKPITVTNIFVIQGTPGHNCNQTGLITLMFDTGGVPSTYNFALVPDFNNFFISPSLAMDAGTNLFITNGSVPSCGTTPADIWVTFEYVMQ
jgi:hypothetical protein